MQPTREQIETASYQRWLRRGGGHGADTADWIASEKDLVFALNYRYIARYQLEGEPVFLGKSDAPSSRRCRFCEQAEPATSFRKPPSVVPAWLSKTQLVSWDECDQCRLAYEQNVAPAFESFARPMLDPSFPSQGSPPTLSCAAWKALVRVGLAILPAEELSFLDDTLDWVSNPDHVRDLPLLTGLGCQVYLAPAAVPSPFVMVARRCDDDAPLPYLLFFLGASNVVFQTHLPFCPRDENLELDSLRRPELSLSLGNGPEHQASIGSFFAVETIRWSLPDQAARLEGRIATSLAAKTSRD
ncbi:MAG: hypothetical protein NVSMB9_20290 [Isosphaeraceae bacterium]